MLPNKMRKQLDGVILHFTDSQLLPETNKCGNCLANSVI